MTRTPKVAIVGTGLIGCAWAVSFARGGCEVALYDRDADAAAKAPGTVRVMANGLSAAGMLDGSTADDIARRLHVAGTLEDALAGAAHVQENVSEKVEIKRAVFADLDAAAEPGAVLASSTSFLLPSTFTETLPGRHRCLVAHPINPPSVIPAVEVVPAPWTDRDAVETCARLMERIGQKPIRMKREVDGFLMNRLQGALLHEAFRLVENGIASPEDVDVGIAHGLAPRWALMGPFETIDLNAPGGVRDYVARYRDMYHAIGEEQRDAADWAGEALDRVEAWRRAALPLGDLPEAQARRDRRLVALMKHLRSEEAREEGE